jgi:hypothetical protein
LEHPDAPKRLDQLSTKATHQHGAVQPFVAAASERLSGYDTYRVYLLFDDDIGQSMYAIYGDEYSELSLHTDDNSPFFNVEDPFGANTGGVHPAMFEVKPESQFDSWLTFNQDDGANKEKIKCAVLSLVEFKDCHMHSAELGVDHNHVSQQHDSVRIDAATAVSNQSIIACRHYAPIFGALVETILTLASANSSIGIEWDDFNSGAAGALKTSDGAVFLMNPEDIPEFTGELPPEVICRCISRRSVHKPVGPLPHSKRTDLPLPRRLL